MTTPSTEALDGQGGPGSETALVALLLSHQRQRWRRGERAPVEAYLDQEPALRGDAEAVLDLIYNEVVLREEAGETPRVEDYLGRFPELAAELRLQFEVERAIRPVPFLADGDNAPGAPATGTGGRTVVADFEILGELGRGGMGVVYRARQARLNRVVALKMILAGKLASPETAARFLAEAEAVARLRHPNIVQVYACGDHDGCPYFAMEYLPGGTLADRLDNTPRPARAAAELIATLARAMSAAHRLGIVHRDLKPANILLDEADTPKIGDFGLAKYLGADSNLTGTQAILGSPSYMAPEQAGGPARDVGPAADVYSLGAILYELMTGRPPFLGETPLETLEQVRDREPVPPSRLLRSTPRDLETICLTCLHKEPPRRYADTASLAEDIDRFLHGEPIRARPVGRVERAWRWCRREPTRAGLAGGLVGALAIGFIGVATQWQRAEANLREARLQRRNSDANYRFLLVSNGLLRRANDREALARRRAQDRFDLAMAALRDLEAATNDAAMLREPKMEGLRKQMLQTSLRFYQDLQASLEEDASLEARSRLADAYRRGAAVSSNLGLYEESLAAHRRALALVEPMAAEAPSDPQIQSALASTHVDIGIVLNTLGRSAEALPSFERARAIQEGLARRSPENLRRREVLSWTLGNIGASYLDMGRPADAARMHGEVLEIREALLAAEPGNHRYRSNLAWCLYDLALAQEAFGEGGEALRLFERATAIQEDVVKSEPRSVEYRRRLGHCLDAVGRVCLRLGRVGEAAGPLETAAEYREVLARDHPALFRDDLAQSLIKLAKHRAAAGLREQAAAYLERADSLVQQTSPARPATLYELGCAYSDCSGRLADDPKAPADAAAALAGRAVTRLRQAVDAGFRRPDDMRRDPDLDPIRSHREFEAILLDAAFPLDPF